MDSTPQDGLGPALVVSARRGLHAVAERLLAGPQWQASGEISLTVTHDGFVTTHPCGAGIAAIRVCGPHVIREPDGSPVPLTGSITSLAAQLGVRDEAPVTVYPQASSLAAGEPIDLTGPAATLVLRSLIEGDAALRRFGLQVAGGSAPEPILWPEHFDVGISLDEVNYGVSPGDDEHDLPYAYVGPWTMAGQAPDDFWNEAFGASLSLPDGGSSALLVAFFTQGRDLARAGTQAGDVTQP